MKLNKLILLICLVTGLLVWYCSKEESEEQKINPVKITKTLTGWEYNFIEGWNIFSLPIEPTAGTDPSIVFEEIVDDVCIIKTWGLKNEIWWPEVGVNSMVLDCRMGYMIRVYNDCSITITGTPTTAEVDVLEGWQLIGYPEQDTIQSGMFYYFGDDPESWQMYDHAKNLDGTKLLWGVVGFDDTMEPGVGLLLHNATSNRAETFYDIYDMRIYFNMQGNRINYSDINGKAIELTIWDQNVIEIHKHKSSGMRKN